MTSSSIQAQLFKLRSLYIVQLEEKIEILQQQWSAICKASGKLDASSVFQRSIHNLKGTAGTYGYPQLSEIASEIESLLNLHSKDNHMSGASEQLLITDYLQRLAIAYKTEAEHDLNTQHVHTEINVIDSPIFPHKPLLFIVDDDENFCAFMTARLESKFECHISTSKTDFINKISAIVPDAVIMDMMLPEGQLAGADAAVELVRQHKRPIVFLSVRDDQESRLAAVRAGADGYFLKSDDPAALIDLLDRVINRQPSQAYRVLMVDDDIELCAYYQLKFQNEGIQTRVINSAINTLKEIEEFQPDIILMDINMPEINGLELGALIRQYKNYNHIPIMYLTALSGDDLQVIVMRLGADDFLSKTLNPDHLTQLLLARLARARITRQGEQSLQVAMNDLKSIQNGLNQHAIVSIADLNGRITFVNDKFVEISGYSRDELIGNNHSMVKSGIHEPEFYRKLWAVISSGSVWQGIITNRKKNGEFYTVMSTITPMLDEFGTPKKYLSVRTDISQINKLNEVMRSEREQLSLALESTNSGIWEWNINLDKTFYHKNWNQLLGYPELSTHSWPMLIHQDDYIETVNKILFVLNNEENTYSSEHRKKNFSGNWDWVLETGKVVETDENGSPTRVMGTMQIINERKAAEANSMLLRDQLNQAMKMEAVGHLTAGIAHDFNNILGAMLGYLDLSEMLLVDKKEDYVKKLERYLGMIKSSGTRAKELIAQMLTFSRLTQSDDGENEAPILALAPIVKEVVSLLRSSIPSTIKLNYQIESDALVARIQPVHLHQIILNLGINARDAIDEFGKIDILLSKHISHNQLCNSCKNVFSGEYAKILVRDSGSGIPDHLINKIFDPFFTTKEVGKGTGMGLSVVHGLVHALGGHILLGAGAVSGTEISIFLPLMQEMPKTLNQEPQANTVQFNFAGARIMVVDDELGMVTMLHEFLSIYGANIISFTDSKKGLEHFASQYEQIDLVITDETMPDLSGIQLTTQLLNIKPVLPIILCTGYSEHATPESAKALGIAGFFRKPLEMDELLKQISALLQENYRSVM